MKGPVARRRLRQLAAAGLIDSLGLSLAWTVFVLHLTRRYGLPAAGFCSAAMLAGVALSAPAAAWTARNLNGRQLLRAAAAVEAVLRVSVFVLVLTDAPLWWLIVCVTAMNVAAWTGYAGMRAEVAAVTSGARALTWYGTGIAAVEAVGVGLGALLPLQTAKGGDPAMLLIVLGYAAVLLPTFVVAGKSTVPRAIDQTGRGPRTAGRAPMLESALLMLLGSGPTLLAVPLAAAMHGRHAVALSAAAFTGGSLLAPMLTTKLERWGPQPQTARLWCALAMVVGWTFAPLHLGLLCLAQALSGISMTALEGMLDAATAERQPAAVTGALARVTAARALGSAAATATLPPLLAVASLPVVAGIGPLALLLATAAFPVARRCRGVEKTSKERHVMSIPESMPLINDA